MKRKLLRKKVQEVLKSAKIEGIGDDVFCRKSTPHEAQELPYIIIYSNNESTERLDESPKSYIRNLELVVEVITSHDTDELLCDELDDLVSSIETALELDPVLQGFSSYYENYKVEDFVASSVRFDQDGGGSSPIGSASIVFNISYYDDPYASKIARSPFSGVETKWNIGDHGDNNAEDSVDLPQEC